MGAFQDWRRECEAVEKEMDRLITAGRPASSEERQVRQLQFTALIARRDAAARSLLKADAASSRFSLRKKDRAAEPGAAADGVKTE